MKRTQKWVILGLISLIGLMFGLCPALSAADKFPDRAVTVINPMPPGGGTDIELRNVVPYFQKYLGQSVVIKPMTGGSTTIAVAAAEQAKPDGYTIVCVPLQHSVLSQNFNDSGTHLENFEPVYAWFEGPMSVEVKGDSPIKSFKELIEESKKRKLKTSLAGVGSTDHLHNLLLEKILGLNAIRGPYGGGGPASKALLGGEVDFRVGLSTTSVRFVRAGQMKSIVILGPKRVAALGDAPTIYELGYKDYPNISFVRGILAPPKTPPAVIKVLEEAFRKAVDDPGFLEIMKKQGRPVKAFSAAEMKDALDKTVEIAKKYVPMMKQTKKK
ncbi:MAG: tripartite tricarboxylate transporter substrate binding protein [Pseudomonadota bacterium]